MTPRNLTRARLLRCAILAAGSFALAACASQPAAPHPDVHYEPTPMRVVQTMLWLADVGAGDVVYDLGCGDGRIVIAAARRFRARGVCVDIDPQRIAESRKNARAGGVEDRIRFRTEDFRDTPIGDATVVVLFLSPVLNRELRPKLLRELKPGTVVISHWHSMGEWQPELTAYVHSDGRDRPVYRWTVPQR